MDKKYISAAEAAEYTGLCLSIIRRLTRSKGFYPAIRVGRRIIINREALDKWLLEQKRQN